MVTTEDIIARNLRDSEPEVVYVDNVNGLDSVLAKYKTVKLPIKISSVGDKLIAPSFRRKMKEDTIEGLIVDLTNNIELTNAELVRNDDGLMIVAQNDEEGFYTIEVDFKIKNMDYDPFD